MDRHTAKSLAAKLLEMVDKLGQDIPVCFAVNRNTPIEEQLLAQFVDCNKPVVSASFVSFHNGEEVKAAYILLEGI